MISGWREQGFGVGPISHQEIMAWSRLYRMRPTPAETSVLRELDRAFVEYHNKKTTDEPRDSDGYSTRPMTPELFDSLFK